MLDPLYRNDVLRAAEATPALVSAAASPPEAADTTRIAMVPDVMVPELWPPYPGPTDPLGTGQTGVVVEAGVLRGGAPLAGVMVASGMLSPWASYPDQSWQVQDGRGRLSGMSKVAEGVLDVSRDGAWSFTLNNDALEVAGLAAGETRILSWEAVLSGASDTGPVKGDPNPPAAAATASSTQSIQVLVVGTNDGPTTDLPAEGALTMRYGETNLLQGITLKDVDAGDRPMTVLLMVQNGTLEVNLRPDSGVVAEFGDGITPFVRLTGAIEALNAVLQASPEPRPGDGSDPAPVIPEVTVLAAAGSKVQTKAETKVEARVMPDDRVEPNDPDAPPHTDWWGVQYTPYRDSPGQDVLNVITTDDQGAQHFASTVLHVELPSRAEPVPVNPKDPVIDPPILPKPVSVPAADAPGADDPVLDQVDTMRPIDEAMTVGMTMPAGMVPLSTLPLELLAAI